MLEIRGAPEPAGGENPARSGKRPSLKAFAGQGLFFVAVAAAVGVLSSRPVYHEIPAGEAQIKLALQHGGARAEDCRRLSADELARLPTNERRPNTCSRERLPVVVELSLDGRLIYQDVLPPTGLSRDGASRTYRKFLVPAGQHVIDARLRDTKRASGFDYEKRMEVDLKPWQNFAIDFKTGGFLFR